LDVGKSGDRRKGVMIGFNRTVTIIGQERFLLPDAVLNTTVIFVDQWHQSIVFDRRSGFLSAHQDLEPHFDSRRHGYLPYEQRVGLEAEHGEQGRFNVECRRKEVVEIRRRPRVGRSCVRRHVENDDSGCVGGKEHDHNGGVENL
ncbi:hypothetical protein A2U01_0043945, partial [Trifolium medium]|nr:hypothetical protein [Trifolium medium]